MNVTQVAEIFGLSVRTVYEKCAAGDWPHKNFGDRLIRFSPEHVQQIADMAEVPVRKREKPQNIAGLVSRLQ